MLNWNWFRKRRKKQSRRLAKPRRLVVESLESRQLLSASPPLDPIFAAILAKMTPNPGPTGDQPTDTAQVVTLAAYTPIAIFDPGIAEIEPFVQGEQRIVGDILSDPTARPSIWGEPATAGTGEYLLHLCGNGMLVSQWKITWGDGSAPQEVGDGPWVTHAYAGNATQYAISVTATSPDGTFIGGMGAVPGALDQDFDGDSNPTRNRLAHGRNPEWATQVGGEGQQTTNFESGSGFDQASAVTLDDGNILVAGTTAAGQFGLVRYLDQPGTPANDGEPDTSFGSGGLVTTTFSGSAGILPASAAAVAVDRYNQTIVVAGTVLAENGDTEVALARYNDADGSADTTFGPAADGTVTTDLGPGWTQTSAVAVESDDSILVAGCLNGHFAILHYNSDGSQDTSFGDGITGIATVDFGGSNETPSAMALDSYGRILVAGSSSVGVPPASEFALARLNSDGSLDTFYGTGGLVTTAFGGGNDVATALAIQRNGSILVAGYSELDGSYRFAVARYTVSGFGGPTLDKTFGTGGLVTTSFGDGDDRATGIVVQSDGKIVVSGSTLLDGNGCVDCQPHFALARYLANGTPDDSFGTGPLPGAVTTDFSTLGFSTESAAGLIRDANGRLIVAGTASTSPLPSAGEGQGEGDGYSSFAVSCYDPGPAPLGLEINDIPPVLQVFSNAVTTAGQVLDLSPLGRFMHAAVTSGSFSYAVDWGDGSTPDAGTATIVDPGSGGTQLVGTIAGQHTYAAAGDYCVVATVTDPDGGSDSQTLAVTVNAAVPPPPGSAEPDDSTAGAALSGPTATISRSSTDDATNPSGLIDAGGVTFTVNFSEDVEGVSAADFAVAGAGVTGTIESVTPGPPDSSGCYATCTVTVDGIGFTDGARRGTLGLDLLDNNSIVDAASNPLGGPALGDGAVIGPAYTIDDHLYWDAGTDWAGGTWYVGGVGSGVTTTWIAGSDAILPNSGTAITIDGSVAASSVTFASSNDSLSGGTLDLGATGGTIDVGGNSTTIYSTIIGSCLAKMGPGMLALLGANGIDTTQIGQGTLKVGNPAALGLGAVYMCYAGTLDLNDCSTIVLSALSGRGGTITDDNATSGTTSLTVDQSMATEFDGVLADGPTRKLSLDVDGGGNLTLGGANTFSGTEFGGGSVTIANPDALQNSTLAGDVSGIQFGAMLTTAVIGGLSGSGGLAIGGVNLSIGNNNQSTEFTGCISGWGSVTKIGSGTLTVDGTNTYSGGTAVAAGGFQVNGSIIGPVSVTGGTLQGIAAPAAPTGFTTTLAGDSEIDLQWTANPANLSGFLIQQSNDGGATWLQTPVTVGVRTSDWVMPVSFASQEIYVFQIQAVNVAGVASSPATLAVLGSPTFKAITDTQVSVSWPELPANVVNYVLQRSDDDGCSWTSVGTSGAVTTAGLTSVTNAGLSGGTTYEYEVAAELPGDTWVTSAAATVTTLLTASNLTATYVSGNEIDLDWEDNSPATEGFKVQELPNGSTTWSDLGTVAAGETSYVVSGAFNAGTTWQFQVQALDGNGNPGPLSAVASVPVPSGLPAAPPAPALSANSPYQVGLTWSDTASGLIGFIVERQEPGDTTWQDVGTTTGGSFTDNMVQGETTYSYCLVATNAAGGSMPGSVATVQTGLLAPTGLQATVLAANQVVLNWSEATSAGDGFTVVESTTAGNPSTWGVVAYPSAVPAGSTSTVITGTFANGQSYYFAICKAGAPSSAFSVPTHVTIPNLPAAPANLSAVWDGNAFRLTWTNHAADVQESDFTCVTPYGTETFPVYGSAEEYDLTDFSLIGLTGQPYPGDYQFSIQSRTAGGVSASTTAVGRAEIFNGEMQ